MSNCRPLTDDATDNSTSPGSGPADGDAEQLADTLELMDEDELADGDIDRLLDGDCDSFEIDGLADIELLMLRERELDVLADLDEELLELALELIDDDGLGFLGFLGAALITLTADSIIADARNSLRRIDTGFLGLDYGLARLGHFGYAGYYQFMRHISRKADNQTFRQFDVIALQREK